MRAFLCDAPQTGVLRLTMETLALLTQESEVWLSGGGRAAVVPENGGAALPGDRGGVAGIAGSLVYLLRRRRHLKCSVRFAPSFIQHQDFLDFVIKSIADLSFFKPNSQRILSGIYF